MNRDRGPLLDIVDALEMYAAAGEPTRKSLGHRLAEAFARGERSVQFAGVRDLDESSSASNLLAASQPQVAPFGRRLFLRDVVPVVPTTTMSTPFVREMTPTATELAASGVAELDLKPDVGSTISLRGSTLTPDVLAASLTTTDQLWADAPAFAAYVNTRLPYLIRVREEYAAFRGNGEVVNARIVGILNDPDTIAGSPTSGDLIATVLNLAADVADNGVIADYAFVNARDWLGTLGHAYGGTGNGGLSIQVLNHAPFEVLPTISLPRGAAIVGDFGNGAVLAERQGVSVELFDQHADYRKHGLDLLLAEERVDFKAVQPWAFAYATGGSF